MKMLNQQSNKTLSIWKKEVMVVVTEYDKIEYEYLNGSKLDDNSRRWCLYTLEITRSI